MSFASKSSAVAVAAAAAFFVAGVAAVSTPAQAADVHCVGGNACKGTSACKGAHNECKGLNSCKGQGWVPTKTKAECVKAGGKPA